MFIAYARAHERGAERVIECTGTSRNRNQECGGGGALSRGGEEVRIVREVSSFHCDSSVKVRSKNWKKGCWVGNKEKKKEEKVKKIIVSRPI